MAFFPYAPRPFQEVASRLVSQAVDSRGHLVLEMPTGSGKTVVLLAGALEAALRSGRRVLYVSRTHTQQEHTIKEFNAIRARAGLDVQAFALQGRGRLCLKLEESGDPEWSEASPDELSHFCQSAKAATDRDASGPKACRFWAGLQRLSQEELAAWSEDGAHTAEWVRARSQAASLCPYELVKKLLPSAHLVVAPYIFAFDAGLRRRLMEWWGCQESEAVLVVDEAHNVPAYLRELHSPRLTRERLRRALLEVQELGNPEITRGLHAREFLEAAAVALDRLVGEYCKDEDGFVPPFEFEALLLERFGATTRTLREAARVFHTLGEAIRDRRKLVGKIPRSHLSQVGSFLEGWLDSDEEGYVKLAGREPHLYLEAFLVDAARANDTFTRFHASIHASGTLDPLEEYRDSLGLPADTRLERFPSPFPADRLRIWTVSGVTTRHENLTQDPQAMDRLQEYARSVVESLRVKAACFLPSHRLLRDFEEVGVFAGLGAEVLVERGEYGSAELAAMLDRHRNSVGPSLLAGVVGGRLSEGLDFPGRQLEAVVVVGVPFPKPTAHQRALFHHYETRFGRGWDYAVRAPALRRLRQALGRIIRSHTDRGFAIILDERAGPFLQSARIEARQGDLAEVLGALAAWQEDGRGEVSRAAGAEPRYA